MAKFLDVDPDEVPNLREPHRGRISYPLLKQFMELNAPLKKLDRTGIVGRNGEPKTLMSLTASLQSYIKLHGLPVSIFTRTGELYFVRLDLNDDGSPNPDYVPPEAAKRRPAPFADATLHEHEDDIPEITASDAVKRMRK